MPATKMNLLSAVVADLKEYKNNPRKNDAAVPDMVKLITEFGFRVPIIVRGNQIVDGHLRVKAAKAMGLVEVPAIDVGDMTATQEKALRIAINKSVDWAEWDAKKLDKEFKDILKGGLSLDMTGFDTGEVSRMTKAAMSDDTVKKMLKPALAKTTDADAGSGADPAYVSLTFHMSAVRRDEVMDALKVIQTDEELGNPSQALIHLCKSQ